MQEFGVQRGKVIYKNRLYGWFGKRGFGYKGVSLPAQPLPPVLQRILELIKNAYPSFEGNGCMVTIYPPLNEKDLADWEGKEVDGMNGHQVGNISLGL